MRVSFLKWVSLKIKRRLVLATLLLILISLSVDALFIVKERSEQVLKFDTFSKIISEAIRNRDIVTVQKSALLALKDLNGYSVLLVDQKGEKFWGFPSDKTNPNLFIYRVLSQKIDTVDGPVFLKVFVKNFPYQSYFIFISVSTVLFAVILFLTVNRVIKSLSIDLLGELNKVASDEETYIYELEETRKKIQFLREKELNKEKQLREQSALAAIGRSAAMIAHDVRKPLTSLKAFLNILPEKRNDLEFIRKITSNLEKATNNTNQMLSEILEFSRDADSLDKRNNDPQSIVIAALGDALRNEGDVDIGISYFLGHKNYLNVDNDRIIRVITNIISNAIDAMGGKGNLWFRTIEIGNKEGNDFIEIIIGNDGPVISEDIQKKIFEPFFTKNKKGGTGLGLAICQKIVEMHGGKISVSSFVADGSNKTEFTVELPASPGSLKVNEAELIHHSSELKPFRDKEVIHQEYGTSENMTAFLELHKKHGRPLYLLLVDDEPLFRETVRSLLNSIPQVKDHVKVIESNSAEVALRQFESGKFDYVITDIDLGKNRMDGYEFAGIILDNYPNTYVLIHSNKRKEEMDKNIRELRNPKFMGFLPKPMTQPELFQFLACKSFETKKQKINADKKGEKNILIVNDDEDFLLSYKILFGSQNVQIHTATNMADALRSLVENKIDMILSDINLGDNKPNGYDFLKQVREEGQSIPFYMMSGYSKNSEEPKAVKMGANGYLQLPIEKSQIEELIRAIT